MNRAIRALLRIICCPLISFDEYLIVYTHTCCFFISVSSLFVLKLIKPFGDRQQWSVLVLYTLSKKGGNQEARTIQILAHKSLKGNTRSRAHGVGLLRIYVVQTESVNQRAGQVSFVNTRIIFENRSGRFRHCTCRNVAKREIFKWLPSRLQTWNWCHLVRRRIRVRQEVSQRRHKASAKVPFIWAEKVVKNAKPKVNQI